MLKINEKFLGYSICIGGSITKITDTLTQKQLEKLKITHPIFILDGCTDINSNNADNNSSINIIEEIIIKPKRGRKKKND